MGWTVKEFQEAFSIDPDLVRLRRNHAMGKVLGHWKRGPDTAPILVVAENPEKVDDTIWRQVLDAYDAHEQVALVFMHKYIGYMMPHEKAASLRYTQDEIIDHGPQVFIAAGNPSLRWLVGEDLPNTSQCHGQRFSTARGKPVIASLPVTYAFPQHRIALAFDTALHTLEMLTTGEFA